MDYEKLHKYLMKKQLYDDPFCTCLGMRVDWIKMGSAQLSLTVDPENLNILSVPHGGVYFTLADTCAGTAMDSYGSVTITAGSTFHFLRSGKLGDTLMARAQVIKRGKTLSVVNTEVVNQDETLLCSGSFTYYDLGEPYQYED